jgi:glycosyltransferase 2 family protein
LSSSSPARSIWRNVRGWLPGIVISIIAVFVIVKTVNWNDLRQAFLQINPWYILIGYILVLVFLGFRALTWQTLLGNKVSFIRSFWVINVGYLLNNIFPLRAGEIGRAILMGDISGSGAFYVLSTIIIERAFDLALAAGFLLSMLPLALGMDWAKPVAMATLGLVVLGLGVLFLIARFHIKVEAWVEKFGKRWVFVQRFVLPGLKSLLNGLGALTNPKQFFLSFFWLLLAWLTTILNSFIFIHAVAPQAQLWWSAFSIGVLSMGIALPSAPAALGIYEGSLVAAMTILGISPSSALACAVVIHFMGFSTTIVLGLIGLAREGRSLKQLFSETQIHGKQTTSGS